ncbi:hypothetical protein SUGI_1089160 [Cryptomeria japonica]|nr:hypothetical protein SUGI_1089160 [Cryptomeria japonica]
MVLLYALSIACPTTLRYGWSGLCLRATRSWDFIGFLASAQTDNLEYHSDIIIGLLDTGISQISESFTDVGFGPIPSKWRGGCHTTSDFLACNNDYMLRVGIHLACCGHGIQNKCLKVS